MTQKEINELRARVYSILNCMFPLDAFLNDIEQIKNQNYDKKGAYNDLKLITDAVYELKEKLKAKEQDYTLEEVKKEWEEDGWRYLEASVYIRLYLKDETGIEYLNIMINKIQKEFTIGYMDKKNYSGCPSIDLTLLQRISKTLKALEKEKEDVCS